MAGDSDSSVRPVWEPPRAMPLSKPATAVGAGCHTGTDHANFCWVGVRTVRTCLAGGVQVGCRTGVSG
jgi:hypothetical protein